MCTSFGAYGNSGIVWSFKQGIFENLNVLTLLKIFRFYGSQIGIVRVL